MSYSDNAVMTKVRAQYGKRLGWKDYDQLLQKKSVGEVASYLKNETYYSRNLQEVREDLIHRGQLETLLKRRTLDTYRSLLKYSYDDKLFLRMYTMKNEIEQLLLIIRLLNAGEVNHYIISLPGYLASHMSFDLYELAKIQDFDGLLDVLSHSDYYDVVGRFRPLPGLHIDIIGCEAALLKYYYGQLISLVEHGPYRGTARQDLMKLLHYEIDFHNLSLIYRIKRFFSNSSPSAQLNEKIRSCMIPYRSAISPGLYEQLIEAQDLQEFFALSQHIKAVRFFSADPNLDTGHLVSHTYHIRQLLNQRVFRFSIEPVVVVLTYMALLEIEANNLTNIIEGIRYGVSPEELRSLLTVV